MRLEKGESSANRKAPCSRLFGSVRAWRVLFSVHWLRKLKNLANRRFKRYPRLWLINSSSKVAGKSTYENIAVTVLMNPVGRREPSIPIFYLLRQSLLENQFLRNCSSFLTGTYTAAHLHRFVRNSNTWISLSCMINEKRKIVTNSCLVNYVLLELTLYIIYEM